MSPLNKYNVGCIEGAVPSTRAPYGKSKPNHLISRETRWRDDTSFMPDYLFQFERSGRLFTTPLTRQRNMTPKTLAISSIKVGLTKRVWNKRVHSLHVCKAYCDQGLESSWDLLGTWHTLLVCVRNLLLVRGLCLVQFGLGSLIGNLC